MISVIITTYKREFSMLKEAIDSVLAQTYPHMEIMVVDDNGKTFDLSPDPLLETVCPYVAGFKLGEETDVEASVRPILENKAIFGVNLYEVNMAETVCGYLKEMLAGTGAVRNTLEKYVR